MKLRFSLRTLVCFVAICAVAIWLYGIVSPAWQERRLVKELRAAYLNADGSLETHHAMSNLVQRVKPSSLKKLTEDEDTSLALRCAFELARAENPIQPDLIFLHPDRAEDFFALFERRTGLKPPAWWANAIRTKNVYFEGIVTPTATLDEESDPVTLTYLGDKVAINRQIYDEVDYEVFTGVWLMATNDDAAFVAGNGHGEEFDLFCLEPNSGEPIWRQRVWSTLEPAALAGWGAWAPYYTTTITLQGESVTVWGAGDFGYNVESFDASTGRPIFRFRTGYRPYR